jgi:hypothetical protein
MQITKQNITEEIKKWDKNSLMELSDEIYLLIREASNTIEIDLVYDKFKGSGKCFVAKVDRNTKKILKQIKEESNIDASKYKGRKHFILIDGYYLTCETGSKSQDNRRYIKVNNGIIDDF